MKKVALLVFGQFRTASLILEHNLKEIKKSFGNQTDTIYHIYILTDKEITGNYSELTLNRVQNIIYQEQVEIKLLSYWEDNIQFHSKDEQIMKYYIRLAEGKQGYGDKMWFTANIWYRRYVLWTLFLQTKTEEYDSIMFTRLFDVKIINLRPISNIHDDPDTIYFCMDSMIYGKKEILNLFFSSFNSFIVWTDFQWTYEFTIAFASFDLVLAQTQPTFCSEAQVFHYIWRTFPKWKNIRWDQNALDSPSHMEGLFHIFHIPNRETFREQKIK